MFDYMNRFTWLRRFWWKKLNESEGLVCELVRKKRLRIGVTPVCLVRTRATGVLVQEPLNTSKNRLGLPLKCKGANLHETTTDLSWPCPPLLRTKTSGCLQRVTEPEANATAAVLYHNLSSVDLMPNMTSMRKVSCDKVSGVPWW